MGVDRRCLFCLGADGGFKSEEHPVPESLGNHKVILPRGVVCDRCNRGTLSTLDQTLLDFFPVKMRRTEVGVASKAGKVPITRLSGGGELRPDERFGGAIHGELHPKAWKEERRSRRDPRYSIGIATITSGGVFRGRAVDNVSRALLKVGFGCAWTEQRERLLEPEFNLIREIILGKTRRHSGYVFLARELDRGDRSLNVTYTAHSDDRGVLSLQVITNFYGVGLLTDSTESAPPAETLAAIGTVFTF